MPFNLYPHQLEAVEFFGDTAAVLCGDDMGVGKTVEALEREHRLRLRPREGREKGKRITLVVAPAGVAGDMWVKHVRKHLPSLKVLRMDQKDRKAFVRAVHRGLADVYVVHWEGLRLEPGLAAVQWYHVIADEVHRAANRNAQQTQALKRLSTYYKTGLSGTWTGDKPDQAWSVLNWLYPKQFTSYWSFYGKFVEYKVVKRGARNYKKVTGARNVAELQEILSPFYLRRRKEDVLTSLPEKYYTQYFVDLYPQQRRAYEEMRKKFLAWVGEHGDEPISSPAVVSQLVRLQQFAAAYARMERQKDGTYKLRMDEPSSKLDALEQVLEDTDAQVVVFSSSKQLINLASRRLARRGKEMGLLTGDVSSADKIRLVERFQAGELPMLGATIAAGGESITLTAASTVVFLDRAWSAKGNVQAEDRLHRIGQKNAVHVIDIMARDTVDRGRLQRFAQKWSWIRQLLGDEDAEKEHLEIAS